MAVKITNVGQVANCEKAFVEQDSSLTTTFLIGILMFSFQGQVINGEGNLVLSKCLVSMFNVSSLVTSLLYLGT